MEKFELQGYITPLVKRWWLLAAATLLAATASYLAMRDQPPVYRSRTTLIVGTALSQPNPSYSEFSLANQLASAYADILQRSPVQDATAEALGLSRLPEYIAWQIPGTQLIEIAVLDRDPVRAQAVAAELVNQLVLLTPAGNVQNERQSFVEEQLDELQLSINATEQEVERLKRELERLFSARQIADTSGQITALETKLGALQANYAAMLANSQHSASNAISVLEPANLPSTPEPNNLAMYMLTAALLGLTLAGAAAYGLDFLDDTIRSEQDALAHLELPTLGQIPKTQRKGAGQSVLVTMNGWTPAVDAYGGLRLALLPLAARRSLRRLLITSPGVREDRAAVAANFCVELARSGQKVILVDADLHHPLLQRIFNLRNHIGLTTLLQEENVLAQTLLQKTALPTLRVLTSGPLCPNPAQWLGSERMHSVLEQLQEDADMVVLSAPPVTTMVDASILATQVDGLLLVVASGQTRRALAKRTLKTLDRIGATVLGVVLSEMSRAKITYTSHGAYNAATLHQTIFASANQAGSNQAGRFHINGTHQQHASAAANGVAADEE